MCTEADKCRAGAELLSFLVRISHCFQTDKVCPGGYNPRKIVRGYAHLNELWPTTSDGKLMEAAALMRTQAQNLLSQLRGPLQTREAVPLLFLIEQATEPLDLLANPYSSLLRASAGTGSTLKEAIPEFTAQLTQN